MFRLFPAVAACAVFNCAVLNCAAQPVYKCASDGKLSYGDRPCASGVSQTLAPAPAPAPDPDGAARLARQAALAAQLTKRDAARAHQQEQAAARTQQQAQRAAGALKIRCDRLRLRHQWAEEDVRRAADRNGDAARVKARRQAQAMALECPG